MENYVITISRKFGSNGHAIAGEVSRLLGIPVYDRSAVEAMVSQLIPGTESVSDDLNLTDTSEPVQKTDTGIGLLKGLFRRESRETVQDPGQAEFDRQCEVIRHLAEEGPCIIIGRCADEIFKDDPRALHVFIYASDDVRLKNSMEMLHTGEAEARALIQNEDRARDAYRKRFAKHAGDEIFGRHLLIDSGRFGVEESAKILFEAAGYLFGEQ